MKSCKKKVPNKNQLQVLALICINLISMAKAQPITVSTTLPHKKNFPS